MCVCLGYRVYGKKGKEGLAPDYGCLVGQTKKFDVILQVMKSCWESFNQVTAAFFHFQKNIQILYY